MKVKYLNLNDGKTLSIQAGPTYYSSEPDPDGSYCLVEIGNIKNHSMPDYLLPYREEPVLNFEVYRYVPAELVVRMIEDFGGIASGYCPSLRVKKEKENE